MSENCNKTNHANGLRINFKTTRRPRFKAGAELSGKVNIMNVEVNEVINEDSEHLEVRIQLSNEVCTSEEH